jgi:hypothetical protein
VLQSSTVCQPPRWAWRRSNGRRRSGCSRSCPRALLLGDRRGVAAFLVLARAACARESVQPWRASGDQAARAPTAPRWHLPVQLAVCPHNPHRIVDWVEVREIHVRVGRRGHRWHDLRLWTSLRDPRTAPARELAQLYAHRWEHELYFRDLKKQLRKTALLQSHTVETGAQEIAAVVLASALLATERARAATDAVPVLRVRFGQVLNIVRGMWLFFGPFDDLITDRQKTRIVQRGRTLMRRSLTQPRRARSCPRAVRQSVKRWPRLLRTQSVEGPLHFTLV